MFSTVPKTTNTSLVVQQKATGNSFFRKAGEERFFGAKENTVFNARPVQAKLTVSSPGDPQEKEADAVADRVMRMPEPVVYSPGPENTAEKPAGKEEEAIQPKASLPIGRTIQCKADTGRELFAKRTTINLRAAPGAVDLHSSVTPATSNGIDGKQLSLYKSDVMRQSGRGPPAGHNSFEQTLSSSKGGGSLMPNDTLHFMERRFGADFSGVRIHTDNTASALSSSINAQAFAHGNDIYFNSGKFSPHTDSGGALLAHELTHTIQQGASKPVSRSLQTQKSAPISCQKMAASAKAKTCATTNPGGSATRDSPAREENATLQTSQNTTPSTKKLLGNAVTAKAENTPFVQTSSVFQTGAKVQTTPAVKVNASPPVSKINTDQPGIKKREQVRDEFENRTPVAEHVIGRKYSAKFVDRKACGCNQCGAGISSTDRYLSMPAGVAARSEHQLMIDAPGDRDRGPPLTGTTITISTNFPGIQRDGEGGEDEPEEPSFFDQLKSGFDSTLSMVLPDAVYSFYTKIRDGGIIGFIKESLVDLFKGLFTRFGFSDKEILAIFQVFLNLKTQLPAIMIGLASGDCKPLFAALNLLAEVVGTIAGKVWDKLMAELEPIRLWLIDIWKTFGAPVIDEITAFAGQKWEELKALGRFIWDSFRPIREKGEEVWDWVVKKLGFGTSDEPGFLGYVSGKLNEAWENIKSELQPVIAPINDVIEGIKTLASLASIKQLQEEAKQWLDEVVKTATAMGSDEDAVANKQITLRQVLLPLLNKAIDRLKTALKTAGEWVVEKVNVIATNVSGFISGIQGNTYLAPMYPLIQWVPQAIDGLKDWAVDKVVGLFDLLQTGVDFLRGFIDPLLTLLEKLVSVAGNLLKYLPDLILGVPYMLMPRCIKDPVIKWLTEVVLKQIPIISEFIALTEKWEDIKTAALTVLKQVFIDGQLAKGLWTYFKTLLGILGIDPKLVTQVVAKAAQNFSAIISKPGAFLKNIWTAIKGGFSLFFENIWKHLPKGALDWLFGEVKGATKVAPPKDFSAGSIFGFVLDLFGITKENVYDRMNSNPRIGPEKVKQLRTIENKLTGALEWITVWIKEGPDGLLKKVKKEIGDIKDMVIQGVVSWVTSSIVAEITKKLVTSADPLGIGATLNTIKLVYDTIKTAVAYINRILTMVNSVMDSVAQIISGNTKAASEYLEGVLAKGVPFVVGFAVEVIIGPIGQKIKDIVDGVRKKIDKGIDFLINGALDLIGSIIATGKKAAGAIAGWLGIRQPFTIEGGEGHELYFKGEVLTVASNPEPFEKFITGVVIDATDPQAGMKEHHKQNAILKARAIDDLKRQPGMDDNDKNREMGRLMQLLSENTKHLFGADLPDCGEPEHNPSSDNTSMFAHYMRIKPLTRKKLSVRSGTDPSGAAHSIYRHLEKRKQGSGAYYVKGHLLNQGLKGPGGWRNLTPLSQAGNSAHEGKVESMVKAAVDSGAIVEYTVVANYAARPDKSSLLAQTSDPDKRQLIEAEDHVPGTLTCSAWRLDQRLQRKEQFVKESVVNRIDRNIAGYDLSGGTKEDIYFVDKQPSQISAAFAGKIDGDFISLIVRKVLQAYNTNANGFRQYEQLFNAMDFSEDRKEAVTPTAKSETEAAIAAIKDAVVLKLRSDTSVKLYRRN